MEDIFKKNSSGKKESVKNLNAEIKALESKLDALEEKFIMGEIEKDSYLRMKPKFKERIAEISYQLSEVNITGEDFTKYLKTGINILQNLSELYEEATVELKQKMIGSIFPQNLIHENSKCRTTKENEVITSIRGTYNTILNKKAPKMELFRSCTQGRLNVEPLSLKI